MNALKIAELAGLIGSVAALHLEAPAPGRDLFAQAGARQPANPAPRAAPRQNPGSPTTNPSTPQQPGATPNQTNPNQAPNQTPGNINPNAPVAPGNNPNGVNNPNQVLPAPGLTQRELALRRFFALDNPESESRLTEVGQKLTRLEGQFAENNQRLLKQLGQARMLQGERRAEAMAQVMQDLLQQQLQLQQYLVDLRTAITGELALDASGQPLQPQFNPGGTENQRLNPGAPTTNPSTPRTNPTPNDPNVPGDRRQNPASPTTNPATPNGPGSGTGGTPR